MHASPHSSQIFHYIDEVGTFKERIQWVGDPHRKDGSIVIHNLDYGDNGTFTCDVKNPPDIVGKTSQVTLYVFEKGVRGGGTGAWEAVQRGDQAWLRCPGLCPSGSGTVGRRQPCWDILDPQPQGIGVWRGTKDTVSAHSPTCFPSPV